MENKAVKDEKNASQQSFLPSRHIIRSLKARADRRRSASEKFADWLTAHFGSIPFLAINVVWFLFWLVVNTGLIPGGRTF